MLSGVLGFQSWHLGSSQSPEFWEPVPCRNFGNCNPIFGTLIWAICNFWLAPLRFGTSMNFYRHVVCMLEYLYSGKWLNMFLRNPFNLLETSINEMAEHPSTTISFQQRAWHSILADWFGLPPDGCSNSKGTIFFDPLASLFDFLTSSFDPLVALF